MSLDSSPSSTDSSLQHPKPENFETERDPTTTETRETSTIDPDRTEADLGFTLYGFPISAGKIFGKYILLEELGRGGMGVVYKARQEDLGRIVALKMILSSHLASPEQVKRFYAEARSAAMLRHPEIVAIHEVGEYDDQHYFTMEFVPGPSLSKVLEEGTMPIDRAAQLVMSVARTVEYLHQHGMIHRDLKPSNILIDPSGRPLVSDFGLARLADRDARMTASNTIVGTPGYMAPEQASSRSDNVGTWSDLYSLGAILFELLTGRLPHEGDGPMETLVNVLEGEPTQPRSLNPKIPIALERICLKCLEKNPTDRYSSAQALADDLGRFIKGETPEASRRRPWHQIQRWARKEPALACRLGTMAVCGAILQANQFLMTKTVTAWGQSIFLVLGWAIASVLFQRLLHYDRTADLVRYAWAAIDVLLFSLLVYVNHGMDTALVSGYFLIVSASGLWFRERMVWLTTFLAVAAYATLALRQEFVELIRESPYRHFVFATALAASGFVISYQVRRVLALSRFYQQRPLP